MNEYLFTEYGINIHKDIQKLYVAYIKNILIIKISNIYNNNYEIRKYNNNNYNNVVIQEYLYRIYTLIIIIIIIIIIEIRVVRIII